MIEGGRRTWESTKRNERRSTIDLEKTDDLDNRNLLRLVVRDSV